MITVIAAKLAAFAAAIAASAAISYSLPAFHESTWDGNLANGSYSSVATSFIVPTAYCGHGESQAAFWAGLGEYTIAQAGVALDCSGGHAGYSAWTQFYPRAAAGLAGIVRPGNKIRVTITRHGGTTDSATVTDYTEHWSHTVTAYGFYAGETAETIVEASDGPLAAHSPFHFYATEATR